jgi:hypothetical protein
VPEWLIGTVCKTVVLTGFAGSNPALSTIFDAGDCCPGFSGIEDNKFVPKLKTLNSTVKMFKVNP